MTPLDLLGGGGLNLSASVPTNVGQTGGGINVGGINTGTQGLDTKTLVILAIAAVVVVVLVGWRK